MAATGDVASANGDAAAGSGSSPPQSPVALSAVVKRGNSGGGGSGDGGGGGSRVSLGTKFVVVTAPYSDQIKAGINDSSDQRKASCDQEQEDIRREEDLHEGKRERVGNESSSSGAQVHR